MRRTQRWWLVWALAVAQPVGLGGCERAAVDAPWPADLPQPTDVAEATRLRERGVVWDDRQVRQFYLQRVAEIGPADLALQGQGISLEQRAHAAYTARHNARLTARAMMRDQTSVEQLQARDREKYGAPDGPSFEYLLERATSKGLTGDSRYQSIIDSAQQTDAATNRSLGL